ncbi:HORMA domain containing protein (plasmid) [Burkholderia gladioli]|uniref:HORMA domain containing protein n=1 Tax=Burkholderia gladioli TaxID=28095 RepID=UPI001935F8B4|nr:HORMA domain containing protein [Burkholderia gladioli]QPQ88809.1 HORMA domain containing protein [Burkholderia gladioli]
MSTIATYSYAHSVTYVTDNLLKSLKDIIAKSGLDPAAFVEEWESNARPIKTWLESRHLEKLILDIYDPVTDRLIIRWEIDIAYNWSGDGDGSFWTDTDQLNYAIRKQGVIPAKARYQLMLKAKAGRPSVEGWGPTSDPRSTDGMKRQSLGTTVEHSGLGGETAYWRKV